MREGVLTILNPKDAIVKAGGGEKGVVPPEKPYQSRSDLQAHILCFPDKFATGYQTIGSKLRSPFESRWDWDSFSKVSKQEMAKGAETKKITIEEWKDSFKGWYGNIEGAQKEAVGEILKSLGVDELNDDSLQTLLDFYSYSKDGNGIKLFTRRILSIKDIDKKIGILKNIGGRLFGPEITAEIIAQVVDLEKRIGKVAGNDQEIEKIEKELITAGENPASETKDFIATMEDLLKKSRERGESGQANPVEGNEVLESANACLVSDIGKGREEQQDAGLVEEEGLPEGIEALVVIADGHGQAGEAASSAASEAFKEKLIELSKQKPPLSMDDIIKQAIAFADDKVSSQQSSGGTTLVAAVKIRDKVYIANVGDSRAYAFTRSGELRQITTDHHWEDDGYKYGIKVSKALGDIDIKVKSNGEFTSHPDIFTLDLSEIESLVLCCDGVSGVLSNSEMAAIIKGKSPKEAALAIIATAKGKDNLADNITAAVFKISKAARK